jgi:hypothetical protein
MNFKPEKIPVTFSQLLEICNYQQAILDKYKEFIEQNIVNHILEEDFDGDTWNPMGRASFKRVTIPQSTFMLRCDPLTLKNWKWLQYERPVFDPEYYIKAAFIEDAFIEEGENNAKTN